jgi:hypothetical protein
MGSGCDGTSNRSRKRSKTRRKGNSIKRHASTFLFSHRHSYSLLRYGQTVYTGGAAHSRPQAEAEEMKNDLETIISFNPRQ